MSVLLDPKHVCFNNQSINRLGMGCWAIGGPFSMEGKPLGYGPVNDAESTRTIHAAIHHGVRYFDTAGAYGAGHSERLLGRALSGEPDVYISTKIGLNFDEKTKTIIGEDADSAGVPAAIHAALKRLQRDQIDLLFLHLNNLPVDQANDVFDCMDQAVISGKIRAYGWSTDFADNAEAVATRTNLVAIQHAMNVFFAAPVLMPVIEKHGLLSINRSPLAMGLLTGKYDANSVLPADDIRSNDFDWNSSFKNGRVRQNRLNQLTNICECLRIGGRTTAQGAIGWLWGQSKNTVPIAGCRNTQQIEQNASALKFGELPSSTLLEIEKLIDRSEEYEQRER